MNFPIIVIFKEKHGDNVVLVNSKEGLDKLAIEVFNERYKDGWYQEDKHFKQVVENNKKALSFLRSRTDCDYEEMEIITPDIYD